MLVLLKQGETVSVGFHEADGEINVCWGEKDITVETDWPDSLGRSGVIYCEGFEPFWPDEGDDGTAISEREAEAQRVAHAMSYYSDMYVLEQYNLWEAEAKKRGLMG